MALTTSLYSAAMRSEYQDKIREQIEIGLDPQ